MNRLGVYGPHASPPALLQHLLKAGEGQARMAIYSEGAAEVRRTGR